MRPAQYEWLRVSKTRVNKKKKRTTINVHSASFVQCSSTRRQRVSNELGKHSIRYVYKENIFDTRRFLVDFERFRNSFLASIQIHVIKRYFSYKKNLKFVNFKWRSKYNINLKFFSGPFSNYGKTQKKRKNYIFSKLWCL